MNDQTEEIQSCVSLLREISEMCEHASLTGSLSGGTQRTSDRYNATLQRLVQLQAVPEGLFQTLPQSADYGEIGVEARMLASYATKGREAERNHRRGRRGEPSILMRLAPFVDTKDLGAMIRDHVKGGQTLDMEDLTHLAPFLDRETLGTLVRENLSKSQTSEPEPVPEPPTVEPEEVFPHPPSATTFDWTTRITPPIVQTPIEEKPSLDELVERLKQPNLTHEEREWLLEQMRHVTGA